MGNGVDEYIGVRVNVVNINYDRLPKEVLEREDVLGGYSYLMDRIRYYIRQEKVLLEEAIDKAVTDTMRKGYLKEYLGRKEFITMITKVLTIEEEIELIRKDEREEGREEGREVGREVGKQEEKFEIARTSIRTGLSKEIIAQITRLSIKEIEDLME